MARWPLNHPTIVYDILCAVELLAGGSGLPIIYTFNREVAAW